MLRFEHLKGEVALHALLLFVGKYPVAHFKYEETHLPPHKIGAVTEHPLSRLIHKLALFTQYFISPLMQVTSPLLRQILFVLDTLNCKFCIKVNVPLQD